jgi:hypothetical protein
MRKQPNPGLPPPEPPLPFDLDRDTEGGERVCEGCGCTDSRACQGGCFWVVFGPGPNKGVCSMCAGETTE